MLAIDVEAYGLQYLFPYQRLVTDNILHNEEVSGQEERDGEDEDEQEDCRRNQIIILPTAAGKSLCFQLPAPLLRGVTVVVYPLLGLIADQGRRLQSLGITHGTLTGAVSQQKRAEVLAAAAENRIRVILTNPETLLLPAVRERLPRLTCSHLVIDEAHCISEWGRSFRPTYRELGVLTSEVRWNSVSAFTATASEEIIADIRHTLFHDDAVHLIRGNPDRENIHYSARPTLSIENTVIDIVANGSLPTPLIVFCSSRGDAVRYAQLLRHYSEEGRGAQDAQLQHSSRAHRDVLFYHAGLSAEEKSAIEERFMESENGILCTTCAYGMGMDKSNIRSVLHTFLPATTESYLQESGRGGRDGQQAWAHLAYSPLTIQRALTRNPETPLLPYIAGHNQCRRAALLRTLGVEDPPCSGCDVCDGEWRAEGKAKRTRRESEWLHGLSERERFIFRYLRRYQRALNLEQLAWRARFMHKGGFSDHHHALRYLYHLKEEGVVTVRKGAAHKIWGSSYRVRTRIL